MRPPAPVKAAPVKATRFISAEPAEHGTTLKLTLLDTNGQRIVLHLPMRCLPDLLAALPAPIEPPPGTVRDVQAWRLASAGDGRPGLTLSLLTADGRLEAFHVTPGQIAGMATLATYGGLSAATARRIN